MTTHDPLTPPARTLCDAMSAAFPDPADGPLDAGALRAAARAGLGKPSVPMRSVTERLVPAQGLDAPVPVRIYEPEADGPRPLVVFLHGGGWVLCDLDTHDGLCRQLAALTGALVVSVDYRRAPEHPFPAASHDAYAAARWAAAHARELGCDPDRLFVAGDSSGGNLAAAVALRALSDPEGPKVAGQLLLYPVLDHRLGGESPVAFERGFFHTTAHMRWYWEQYLGAGGDPVAASPGSRPNSTVCRPPSCSSRTATRCVTRGSRTRGGSRGRECGRRWRCIRGCSTGSWARPGSCPRRTRRSRGPPPG